MVSELRPAHCPTCGGNLVAGKRGRRGPRARYCSNSCRQRAYRRRSAEPRPSSSPAAGTLAALFAALLGVVEVELAGDRLGNAETKLVEALRCVQRISELVPDAVEGLAIIAIRRGNTVRGLRLVESAGAIRAHTRTGGQLRWRRQVGEAVAQARRDLDPDQIADIRSVAGQLSPAQVVAYALVGRWPELADDAESRRAAREQQVASLVAAGLTNPQIARRTGVSVRTVGADVASVRRRLNLRSRAELAAWAAKHASLTPQRERTGLSGRQYEVAVLVAAGMTNREIADHLQITSSTVASHVAQIFTRLGLRSRAELAAWAAKGKIEDASAE